MDVLNDLFKKYIPQTNPSYNNDIDKNVIEKINDGIGQFSKIKTDLELYITQKKQELSKLEELYDVIAKSEDTQLKIKQFFKCKTCLADLKQVKTQEYEVPKLKISNLQPKEPFLNSKTNSTNFKCNQKQNTTSTPILNKTAPVQFSKKNEPKLSQNESKTFNRIQNIINNCTNKPKVDGNTKKSDYSTQNKGVVINRKKPYPGYEMTSFDYTQFKTVELHMNEPKMLDFNSITKWTCVTKRNNNKSLENKMQKRSDNKLEQLKQVMNEASYKELLEREDILNDMKMLMNYDFCNNKHGYIKNKPKRVRTKAEIKPDVQNKKEEAKQDDFMFDELFGFEADNKENEANGQLDDLYNDLNDDPVMDINLVKIDKEEGELADEINEEKRDVKETEFKKVLSPRKENFANNRRPKTDIYSQRRSSNNDYRRSKSRYSRSGSRSKKRSRSRTRSRSRERSKRRDYRNYDDRREKYENYKSKDSRYKK